MCYICFRQLLLTPLKRFLSLQSAATMCVSGCSGGVVCYWEVTTGNCRHLLQESGGDEGVSVVKLDILVGGVIVGLMSDETVVVWDKSSGESLFTIALVSVTWLMMSCSKVTWCSHDFFPPQEGVCPDIALLGGGRYMAASVEVRVTKSCFLPIFWVFCTWTWTCDNNYADLWMATA